MDPCGACQGLFQVECPAGLLGSTGVARQNQQYGAMDREQTPLRAETGTSG